MLEIIQFIGEDPNHLFGSILFMIAAAVFVSLIILAIGEAIQTARNKDEQDEGK